MHPTFGARFLFFLTVIRGFKILKTSADYGTDLDASRTANLYIVRFSFSQWWYFEAYLFLSVNKSLKGKWASLACHETGSLVVQVGSCMLMFSLTFLMLAQHAFENLEESAKDGIVEELLNQGPVVFGEVAKNQWGSYCIQHSTYTVYPWTITH
jgi:hypothetical protein